LVANIAAWLLGNNLAAGIFPELADNEVAGANLVN
jgi:hypothetical protein